MEKKAVRSSSHMKTKERETSHGTNQLQLAQERKGKKNKEKNSMKGRESKGAPPADLLVCFPSRSHLNLVPKPICSPSRPIEPTKRHHHHHHLSRSSNRGGLASPSLWARTKPTGSEIAEPTSPKVTCAGQIKVRQKTSTSSKNWQSVMEEIERLHNNRKHKKKPSWLESIGIKKDIMQLPTFLRAVRFDLRCFSPSHGSEVTSAHGEDQEGNFEGSDGGGTGNSRTIFSKWFMILQENKNRWFNREEEEEEVEEDQCEGTREEGDGSCDEEGFVPSVPPPNALLLMRCRSAPAKSLLDEDEEEEEEKEVKKSKLIGSEEEKKKKKTESFILKCYASDFSKVSNSIPKEAWFVGETKIPLSRSRSCKR